MRTRQHIDSSSQLDELAGELASRGYVVREGFVDPAVWVALAGEVRQGWEDGEFRFARIGNGENLRLSPTVRSDYVQWLEPGGSTPAQRALHEQLDGLRAAVNRQTFMGLFEWEGHLAIYPPGSCYRRHLDVFKNARERKVTTIAYLNADWRPGDGGELRLYTEGHDKQTFIDVAPRGGTLVSFLSEQFYHEVLEAHTERLSLTGWFRVRPLTG